MNNDTPFTGLPFLLCVISVIVDAYVQGFELYEICMTAK